MHALVGTSIEREEDLALLHKAPQHVNLNVEGDELHEIPRDLRRLGQVQRHDIVGERLEKLEAGVVELLDIQEGEVDRL